MTNWREGGGAVSGSGHAVVVVAVAVGGGRGTELRLGTFFWNSPAYEYLSLADLTQNSGRCLSTFTQDFGLLLHEAVISWHFPQ